MKIWLDDVRPAPFGWAWAQNVETLLAIIEREGMECIEAISFDNDLGTGHREGHEALSIIERMVVEQGLTHVPEMRVHSMNTVAGPRMLRIIERIHNFAGK